MGPCGGRRLPPRPRRRSRPRTHVLLRVGFLSPSESGTGTGAGSHCDRGNTVRVTACGFRARAPRRRASELGALPDAHMQAVRSQSSAWRGPGGPCSPPPLPPRTSAQRPGSGARQPAGAVGPGPTLEAETPSAQRLPVGTHVPLPVSRWRPRGRCQPPRSQTSRNTVVGSRTRVRWRRDGSGCFENVLWSHCV